MTKLILIIVVFTIQLLVCCNRPTKEGQVAVEVDSTETHVQYDSTVYETETLIIRRLSNHVYQHISFLNTETFGRVQCNGMMVLNENQAIVFDTPSNNESSEELIQFVQKKMNYTIKAIIPTHFHDDCVGGLEKFNDHNIPSYASVQTIALLENKSRTFSKPIKSFIDTLSLSVGSKRVFAEYFGEGHTKDNVIGYFPEDRAVFGGCLIKEVGASKGNLEDANVAAWPGTVLRLKQKYPDTKIIIPGHGKPGGTELLDYTMQLFEYDTVNHK